MLKLNVLNQNGEHVSEIQLSESVFGIAPNTQVLYDVVNAQRAAMRQGTHDTKGRAEVRGGGKKPWRQKGTGRARHGSRRSPIWVGGGVTFGPTPRSYKVKVNRKVSKLAYRSVLSLHLQKDQLIVVDKIELEAAKTKQFKNVLNALNINNRVLFVDVDHKYETLIAARNLESEGVRLENADHTSVYDLMNCFQLVLTVDAVKHFEEVLGND